MNVTVLTPSRDKAIATVDMCNSRYVHLVSPLSTGYGQPIQPAGNVRVLAVCGGLRILRGRPSMRRVPELGHAHCDTHFVLRHHMLSACRRSVHLE
ncbi:hypothetical protein Cfor_07932, partial [Coptotermes formosanus]